MSGKDPYKEYHDTVDRIYEILGYRNELRKALGHYGLSTTETAFAITKEQLDDLSQDKQVETTGADKSRVKEVLNYYIDHALYRPVSPIFNDLVHNMLLIISNWNKELGGLPDVQDDCLKIDKILEGHFTLSEILSVNKQVLEKLRHEAQYKPPSWDLSRAYIQSYDKKYARRKDECE